MNSNSIDIFNAKPTIKAAGQSLYEDLEKLAKEILEAENKGEVTKMHALIDEYFEVMKIGENIAKGASGFINSIVNTPKEVIKISQRMYGIKKKELKIQYKICKYNYNAESQDKKIQTPTVTMVCTDGKNIESYMMERVDGQTLGDYISKNKKEISEDKKRNIFMQIYKQFSNIESAKIYHGDIKLDNMIIDTKGVIHIIDWGCAQDLDAATFKIVGNGNKLSVPHIVSIKYLSHYIGMETYLRERYCAVNPEFFDPDIINNYFDHDVVKLDPSYLTQFACVMSFYDFENGGFLPKNIQKYNDFKYALEAFSSVELNEIANALCGNKNFKYTTKIGELLQNKPVQEQFQLIKRMGLEKCEENKKINNAAYAKYLDSKKEQENEKSALGSQQNPKELDKKKEQQFMKE